MIEDRRFPNDERIVPVIAPRHARPVVTDDWTYRCTPYAAVTPTLMQAFKQMRSKALPRISAEEANLACLTRDCFSYAVGSGYTSPATILGLSGTGIFKSAMLMEKRDLLITAADLSEDHAYAEYNIELYEADEPTPGAGSEIRQLRYEYQQQIADFCRRKLQGILVDISYGITGMALYRQKFPEMMIDGDDQFRKTLQEALKDEFKIGRNGNKLPCIRQTYAAEEGEEMMTLSREAFDEEWTGPRNEFEAGQSHQQAVQTRLEWPEEKAPFQFALQKRTSEVTLTMQPLVRHLTQVQLEASRIRADIRQEKNAAFRGENPKKTFAILNEMEDLMRAQIKKGRFYTALNEDQKAHFNEVLDTPPPPESVTWLTEKLQTVSEFSSFMEIMTHCHVQKSGTDDFNFVMNYVHQNFVLPELRQKISPDRLNMIKEFYLRLYEGDGLLPLFVNERLKTALEYAGHYPEAPSSKLLKELQFSKLQSNTEL